jgi:hypothetical protein
VVRLIIEIFLEKLEIATSPEKCPWFAMIAMMIINEMNYLESII